jgi:hypothetical protein
MTEEVAVIPLILVVRVLPERDCVKEVMIDARDEDTPLTMVWMKLADEDAVFEVMIDDVADDPPRLEVRVLPEAEREFEVVRLVIVALVAVRLVITAETALTRVEKKVVAVSAEEDAVASVVCPDTERLDTEVVPRAICPDTVNLEMVVVARVEEPVATRLVVVAFVVVRLVKKPDTAVRRLEKRVEDVVVARTVVPVRVLSPANVCVPVDTTPREDTPALGMLMVCVEPTEEIPTSVPAVPTVRN